MSPNAIHIPGVYVDRIVKASIPKAIEVLALRQEAESASKKDEGASSDKAAHDWRHKIAKRAAQEIGDGFYVNLGVGVPTLVPEVRRPIRSAATFPLTFRLQHLKPEVTVWVESENGILGMGSYPTKDEVDACVFVSCVALLLDFDILLYAAVISSTPERKQSHCYPVLQSSIVWRASA